MPGPPEAPPRSPSLEEVRQELRRCGYLDSRLDRFLLRDRLRRRLTTLGAVLMISLRVGLLGGPLVGLPLAAATFWTSRTQARPLALLLLAGLLSLFFGVILALLEGLTSFLLVRRRRIGRQSRSRHLATRAAVAVGGAGAVYLGLWWRFRREVLGLTDLLSLAAIIVLALLLAHLVAAAGAAVLGGEAVARQRAAPPRRARWVSPWLLGGTTCLAAALLFMRPAAWHPEPGPAPAYETIEAPGRLIVLGVDGLGWEGVQDARLRRAVPQLGALLDRSAVRRLHVKETGEPPRTWTTLVTGMPPAVHGVQGVLWRSLAGMPPPPHAGDLMVALVQAADALLPASRALAVPEPVSARIRLRPTVWEIMGTKGRRILAAHWWATSPVARLPGYLLSDRAFGHLMTGSSLSGEAYPPAYAASLAERFAGWRSGAARQMPQAATPDSLLWKALLADRFYGEMFMERLKASNPQAAFLYLSSLDIVASGLGDGGERLALAPLLGSADAVRDILAFLDDLVGQLTALVRPGDRLVLLLEPGRAGIQGGGLIAVSGSGVQAEAAPGPAAWMDPLQVAPTLLWLAGFPVSAEMVGTPITDLLDAATRRAMPVRRIGSFGPPPPLAFSQDAAAEASSREYLHSLGYIR